MITKFQRHINKCSEQGAQIYSLMKQYNGGQDVDFANITDEWLYGWGEYMTERVCGNSARTYFSIVKTALRKAKLVYPRSVMTDNFADILKVKATKSVRCYLTTDDLKKIEAYQPKNKTERAVWAQFLIGAYTGARQSDYRVMKPDNIANGKLTYISQKTHIRATIPVKPIVAELLNEVNELREVTLMTFNKVIRRICETVGVNDTVRVYKAGEQLNGEKWRYISSHTARISFATNLYLAGLDVVTIAKMMGHSNISQTFRYIAAEKIELNEAAAEFFK